MYWYNATRYSAATGHKEFTVTIGLYGYRLQEGSTISDFATIHLRKTSSKMKSWMKYNSSRNQPNSDTLIRREKLAPIRIEPDLAGCDWRVAT